MFAPSVPPGVAILESAKQSIRSDVSPTFGKVDKSDGLAVPDKADEWVGRSDRVAGTESDGADDGDKGTDKQTKGHRTVGEV